MNIDLGFQIVGNKDNPYHLSVGTVLIKEDKIALLKKSSGTYTLPRETIYSKESIHQALLRGIQEELGIRAEIVIQRTKLHPYLEVF